MTNVTQPFLPPLQELLPFLERMWESKQLSNNGEFHRALETQLQEMLGVPFVSLFCNATVALMTAQKALDVRGEVITTPYSFAATAHSIDWVGNQPLFVDVEPGALTLDPARLEEVITEKTGAIMPLHCYGNNCDVSAIQEIANRTATPVIYDACHSFGVEDDGGSALRHGDIAVVSFHATKVFHTFEGGLLVTHSAELKEKVDRLKNFGFVDETTVIEAGVNGKMSEFNAAVGLAQLKYYDFARDKRAHLDSLYRAKLASVPGITCQAPIRQTKRNFSYLPIFVSDRYSLSRDQLYEFLRANDVFVRRYFFPLISDFPAYQDLPSSIPTNLPNAHRASRAVLCLPLYPELEVSEVERICALIGAAHHSISTSI